MPKKRMDFGPSQMEYRGDVAPKIGNPFATKTVNVQGDDLTIPVPPDFWRTQPTAVIGRPEEAREVEKLFKLVPELRGVSPSVTFGPSPDFFDQLGVSNRLPGTQYRPEDFGILGLMGLTSLRDKSVTVNPDHLKRYGLNELQDTLGHEFGHVAGYGERDANILGMRYANRKKASGV